MHSKVVYSLCYYYYYYCLGEIVFQCGGYFGIYIKKIL